MKYVAKRAYSSPVSNHSSDLPNSRRIANRTTVYDDFFTHNCSHVDCWYFIMIFSATLSMTGYC